MRAPSRSGPERHEYMIQILTHLGADVERASGTVSVHAEKIESSAPYDVVRKMRASVCVLGPLLWPLSGSDGFAAGGCIIAPADRSAPERIRSARGRDSRGEWDVKVFAPKLEGAVINLRGSSATVLGTDNVLMAAVLAEGTTVIEGAAAEPEVCDLADFLNKMGAKIEGLARAG